MARTKMIAGKIAHSILYCDPRYIYLFFFITVAVFSVTTEYYALEMPIGIPDSVRMLYDKIDKAPKDKIIIIDSDWGVDIRAESEGQMKAVLEHIMRRKLRFAVLSWVDNPQGQKNGYDAAVEIAQRHGYEYGKDWVAWGTLKKTGGATLQALTKDIKGTVERDINGTDLSDLPVMDGIDDIFDVYLVFSVCYDYEGTPWLGFVQGVYGTNYAVGVSAITSSTAYTFLETRQMCGMLVSAPGAASYEELLKMPVQDRFALRKVNVLSMASAYILLAILIGNISFYLARHRKDT